MSPTRQNHAPRDSVHAKRQFQDLQELAVHTSTQRFIEEYPHAEEILFGDLDISNLTAEMILDRLSIRYIEIAAWGTDEEIEFFARESAKIRLANANSRHSTAMLAT